MPVGIRIAGAIVFTQGVVCLGLGVWLLLRAIANTGDEATFGYALASWFFLLGAAVGAGGAALFVGRRWGRAVAIVMQLLLLPIAVSMFSGSQQFLWGFLLFGVVILTFVLMLTGKSSEWMNAE
ncbi:hypothetical protein IEU95_03995 [Hoyosella rhizosphaerae]|uniref:Integral membrane protein n=1 Tax=Hoyosella rhizosphaerae TaxID=1755582 RepID=A0A916XFC8_9ACTN|nr:hypothetical protein [Hoyosella rhizosphaerae]MBN4925976.1 hypothetical protein [Hoyosella rhizosphaerae]GGC66519.1 hypothetical protein GCM10011410_18890 [Hoyosella rhizosphaerae]